MANEQVLFLLCDGIFSSPKDSSPAHQPDEHREVEPLLTRGEKRVHVHSLLYLFISAFHKGGFHLCYWPNSGVEEARLQDPWSLQYTNPAPQYKQTNKNNLQFTCIIPVN